jgi:hypothetical protein
MEEDGTPRIFSRERKIGREKEIREKFLLTIKKWLKVGKRNALSGEGEMERGREGEGGARKGEGERGSAERDFSRSDFCWNLSSFKNSHRPAIQLRLRAAEQLGQTLLHRIWRLDGSAADDSPQLLLRPPPPASRTKSGARSTSLLTS